MNSLLLFHSIYKKISKLESPTKSFDFPPTFLVGAGIHANILKDFFVAYESNLWILDIFLAKMLFTGRGLDFHENLYNPYENDFFLYEKSVYK